MAVPLLGVLSAALGGRREWICRRLRAFHAYSFATRRPQYRPLGLQARMNQERAPRFRVQVVGPIDEHRDRLAATAEHGPQFASALGLLALHR